MDKIKISCLDNSEFAEFDAINKGYRGDIYVKILDKFYNLNIYDIIRLQQDFELELKDYGMFTPEPNLVIVIEVSNIEIKNIVQHLYIQKYFENIKSVDMEKIGQLKLKPLP